MRERCSEVYSIVNDNGWLNSKVVGCLVAYSDELAQPLLRQAPKGAGADAWDAIQVSTTPSQARGITIDQLVFVIPARLKTNLKKYSVESRPHYALRVFCHEFAHAFGCAYEPGVPHENWIRAQCLKCVGSKSEKEVRK